MLFKQLVYSTLLSLLDRRDALYDHTWLVIKQVGHSLHQHFNFITDVKYHVKLICLAVFGQCLLILRMCSMVALIMWSCEVKSTKHSSFQTDRLDA